MNTTCAIHSSDELLDSMPTEDLTTIAKKVLDNKRLSFEEGLYLLNYEEDAPIFLLADYARKKICGDTVYFASTLFVHPTNLCELSCPMCSFYAKPGWKSAWFLTPEQIENKIKENLSSELTEIHVVGGLWRECNLDYYQELFTRIKTIDPNLHIKALTPVEYDFLARLHDISVEEVFSRMMSWGLGSLPGGGAEILVEAIRKQIAPQKITSERYLEIHRIAHSQGLRSNITMLFGHVEENIDIITHLCRVRALQDETRGFQTFIPLKYHDENNALGKRKGRLKEKNMKRVYALSRLMLDNIRNLKVLWNYVGVKDAQEILACGANDFASTSLEEKIIIMAGGVKVKMTKELISKFIEEAGRVPKEIHSGFDYTEEDR
ncbi:MAG: CofH family radical SAM protein [Chlamydiales bacterium]|nr:CofH family radical SAM protein [Chlamydiales bacterium]